MDHRGPGRRRWILTIACLSLLMVTYTYVDNVVITLHGMNVWSALAEGRILDFYAYNDGVSPPNDAFHPVPIVYGFLTFTIIAIWNLPLWLIQEFTDVNVFASVVTLTWMKAINVPFTIGTAWLVQRISVRLAPASRWAPWSGFVFVTSGFLVSAVFLMGQFDVIHVFFSVLGLHYLVQGRRRAFVVAFAVAIAIKWFPLFIFLPVLLLVEKRVSRVLVCLAGSLSVALVFKLPFVLADNPSSEAGSDLIKSMVLDNRLPLGLEGVPIFPLLFILVCVACYLRRPGSPAELHRTAIYAGFAGVSAFFVSAPAYPYWFAMLCPFLVILWAINPALTRVTLLLETGLTAAMVVLHQIVFYWTYDLSTVTPMLLPQLFAPVDSLAHPVNPLSLYTRLGLVPFSSVLAAVFTAGIVSLLVIHRPRTDDELVLLAPDEEHVVGLIRARAVVVLALMLVPASAYLFSLVAHGTTT